MFYLYILQSLKDKRTYVGYTANIERRIYEHNSGRVLATKNRKPLKILKVEIYKTPHEAKKRELYWKSGAGRERLKKFFKKETSHSAAN
jgi:putative endonuclease